MTTGLELLLIDDNPDDRLLIKRELSRSIPDISITEASDQRELEQALAKWRFDIVITDYHLQWTNGFEVFKTIKALHSNCPVILVTGSGSREVAQSGMKLGLEEYVIKSYQHYKTLPGIVLKTLERTRGTPPSEA